jgi:L-alanine-DL-glutamate epimerase-like enolase superfamily enzyme
MIRLTVKSESWPIRGNFTISRGSRTAVEVVTVTLADGEYRGRAECVPYAHYGESVESVTDLIENTRAEIERGIGNDELQSLLPPGAARNALDCALWDLESKQTGRRVHTLLDVPRPAELTTAYTLSLDAPEAMRQAAAENSDRPMLKLKLGGDADVERVAAVRDGAPDSDLILDANEAWDASDYERMIPSFVEQGVRMIEQPFPANDDGALIGIDRPITICADESCHDTASLDTLVGKYDMINIKLDKAGGLTEALLLKKAARAAGFEIMVGCMLGTSLAMAPACVVAQGAEIVDLDGPLLLAKDREAGIEYVNSRMMPVSAALWG